MLTMSFIRNTELERKNAYHFLTCKNVYKTLNSQLLLNSLCVQFGWKLNWRFQEQLFWIPQPSWVHLLPLAHLKHVLSSSCACILHTFPHSLFFCFRCGFSIFLPNPSKFVTYSVTSPPQEGNLHTHCCDNLKSHMLHFYRMTAVCSIHRFHIFHIMKKKLF